MRLEIGSGEYPSDGYEHMDIRSGMPHQEYVGDICNIPFPDNSAEEVKCVMILEHLPYNKVPIALAELRRILIIYGVVKVYVPNLEQLCRFVLDKTQPIMTLVSWFYGGQDYIENFHTAGFTVDLIVNLLMNAGFEIMTLYGTNGIYIEAMKC